MKNETNKCIGCPHYQLLQETNWRYCEGNKCEVEIRADGIRKFAEWLEICGFEYDQEEKKWYRTHFDGHVFAEEAYTTKTLIEQYEKERNDELG